MLSRLGRLNPSFHILLYGYMIYTYRMEENEANINTHPAPQNEEIEDMYISSLLSVTAGPTQAHSKSQDRPNIWTAQLSSPEFM